MNIKERLIQYEGSKEYQRVRGYFRQDKFYPYVDTEGYGTIGYGHKILDSEREKFKNGISAIDADLLLAWDIDRTEKDVKTLGLDLPQDWQDFLVIMTFQLGLGGVKKFRKMLAALDRKDWKEAIRQAKDSLWYRQTPNRLDDMVKQLVNK
ncbi:lysozyme [Escherichia marmotae]|uniref:glycoside hydrolase family protein n=1 Tax=Escherichia TaxID=561 RepID=UPI00141A40AB|nr:MULTISPECIES: glycoside hydrolase family protein [Escherichia]KAF3715722.1 lysozyme [Escherichia marmotae]MBY7334184.1 glycoside hydrolase family protein [Escherichia coli]MBY7475363.1 glycoside hydrolase family protein [Escherichia coli]MDN2007569.1 lysozyme [Escherichia coli]